MLEQTSYAQWIGATVGEYRLTRLLGMSPVGPLFAADSMQSGSTFLVRVLNVAPAQTPEAQQTYQAYLERQAGHIISERHPYMLPLVSYGMYQGLPYLVWPNAAMRTLTTRLTQSGVLDVVTAGRYLDQIAAVLEYAHERATIHRNLSLDCIYLQMDGQIVVGDFGVRRLCELLTPGGQSGFFYGSLEACAPEQLRGGQVGAATDVYALGAITYRLLTGHSVFSGESFPALAEQHLHAPPPSLASRRAGLPPALDRVLADALAKDPAQRIQHPGEFANAYHQVIGPSNTRRVPFDSPGAGSGVSSEVSQAPQGYQSREGPLQRGATATAVYPRARVSHVSAPAGRSSGADAFTGQGTRSFLARSWWFLLLALVLIPLASVGAFFFANNHQAAAVAPSGTLLFMDTSTPPDGSNDGLQLSVRGLAVPSGVAKYEVWLVNQETEQIVALGQLTPGPDQTYQLHYAPTVANGRASVNLLTEGDLVEITEERSNVAAPAGHVLLAVAFPPKAFIHIKHLLLSFPTTPGKIGLLIGVLQQTSLLNAQASTLNQASGTGQDVLVQCLAQSIVDISEGAHGAHYRPLSAACGALGVTEAGDGFGLLNPPKGASGYSGDAAPGYIKNAADHASLATATPDATEALRQHASQVETTLAAVTKSVTAADAAALKLLASPTDGATVAELVTAAAEAYQGTGASGAGGAVAAYQQGQLMASLTLAPPTA